jgi:hypothetical protein
MGKIRRRSIKAKTLRMKRTEVPGFKFEANFDSQDSLLFDRRGGVVDVEDAEVEEDAFSFVCGCSGSLEGGVVALLEAATAAGGEISREEGEELEVFSLDVVSALVLESFALRGPSVSAEVALRGSSRPLLLLRPARSLKLNDPELSNNVRGFGLLLRDTYCLAVANTVAPCLGSNGFRGVLKRDTERPPTQFILCDQKKLT